ncbi:MAG: hypothetical protein KDN22_30470 [Verrucomicrobiae bacterium]|nr:hypothetical protein [Verrucomicrobiae bacterium]
MSVDGNVWKVFAVAVAGLIVGGTVQRQYGGRARGSDANDQVPSVTARGTERLSPVLAKDNAPAVRPTLEQILAARQTEAHELAAAYLRDATIDEVTELLVAIYSDSTNRFHELTAGLTVVRGVELAPARFAADVRAQLHTDQEWRDNYRIGAIFAAWAQRDIEAALAASALEDKAIRQQVIDALAETDPARALAYVRAEFPGNEEMIRRIENKSFTKLATADLAAALDQASAISQDSGETQPLQQVLNTWALSEPLAALEWVASPDGTSAVPAGNREWILDQVISMAAKANPAATRRILNSMPLTKTEKVQLQEKWIAEVAASNPEEALAVIRREPDAAARARFFESYVTRAATPAAEILRLVTEMELRPLLNGNDKVNAALGDAITELAKESPEQAMRAALDAFGLEGDAFRRAFGQIVAQRASGDAKGTADWVFGLPESKLSRSAQADMVELWAKSAPEEAAQFLVERHILAPKRGEVNYCKVLTRTWVERDASAALTWAASMDGSEADRDQILMDVIGSAAWKDPAASADFIDSLSTAEARTRATRYVASGLSNIDPIATMDWLMARPDDTAIAAPLQNTATAAVLANPALASEKIGALPAGLRRDQAVAGMIDALVSPENPVRDVDAALNWAATISDQEIMQSAVKAIQRHQASQ